MLSVRRCPFRPYLERPSPRLPTRFRRHTVAVERSQSCIPCGWMSFEAPTASRELQRSLAVRQNALVVSKTFFFF